MNAAINSIPIKSFISIDLIIFCSFAIFLSPLRLENLSSFYSNTSLLLSEPLATLSKYSIPLSLSILCILSTYSLWEKKRSFWSLNKIFIIYAITNIVGIFRTVIYSDENLSRFILGTALILLIYIISFKKFRFLVFEKAFFYTSVIFVAGHLYQWIIDPSVMQWKGRWMGIVAHPNHLGAYSAGLLLTLLPSLFNKSKYNPNKLLRLSTSVLLLLLCLLSGSRTSLLILSGGIIFQLAASRIKWKSSHLIIIALIILGMFAIIYLTQTLNNDSDEMRITTTENTRIDAWKTQFQDFGSNPLFGAGKTEKTESSLFAAMSIGGILVGLGYFTFILSVVYRCIRTIQESKFRQISSSQLAFQGALLGLTLGSLFEGYGLMALQVYSLCNVMILICCASLERQA